jgi:hypothetical protein
MFTFYNAILNIDERSFSLLLLEPAHYYLLPERTNLPAIRASWKIHARSLEWLAARVLVQLREGKYADFSWRNSAVIILIAYQKLSFLASSSFFVVPFIFHSALIFLLNLIVFASIFKIHFYTENSNENFFSIYLK